MRRRLTASLLIGLATVVTGTAGWLVWPRSSAICKENYDRLAVGMTLSEVEEVLGGPERRDSTGHLIGRCTKEELEEARERGFSEEQAGEAKALLYWTAVVNGSGLGMDHTSQWKHWYSDEAIISVRFNTSSKLADKEFLAVKRRDGLWPMVRRWLRL